MKVLLVSWEYPPVVIGGLGRHVHHLATELVAAGHVVVVGKLGVAGTETLSPPSVLDGELRDHQGTTRSKADFPPDCGP